MPPSDHAKELPLLKKRIPAEDHSLEFHDPFSELNLFLSRKITEECKENGLVKKWSLYLQDRLIEKITPEFQRRFPGARLGVASLKKLWEKISYLSVQLQGHKEAMTKEGKLDVNFLIRENLKYHFQHKRSSSPQYAHQLALKISEYVATIDGIRPVLDHLTKMIWATGRYLDQGSSQEAMHSPYDEFDKLDRLIVKNMLEITAKHTHISQRDLEIQVKEALKTLQELPICASLELITSNVAALLADKLYTTSPFHILFSGEQKMAVFNFIKRHISLYKTSAFAPQFSDVVRRTQALYTLACQLPKNLSREEFTLAVKTLHDTARPLSQVVYAFVAAELHLIKGQETDTTHALFTAYQEAQCLPELSADTLEMLIWKVLGEKENLLDKLSYRSGQKVLEEVANVLIDNPDHSFSSILHFTVQLFKKTKELTLSKKWGEIEQKITHWTNQGDLLCRWVRLETESVLLKLILQEWTGSLSHSAFVCKISEKYLQNYPAMAPYAPQITKRVAILYKYAWYALLGNSRETSFERFILWHFQNLSSLSEEAILVRLEEICKEALPLIPFDRKVVGRLLASQQKIEPETEQRQA